MSIGLYDADMMKYTLTSFNLELMKISYYYKRRGEIVILSPQFTPERNTRFIYRKDYDDGEYPNFSAYNNVEYGGLAFSRNVYKPLDLNIEKSPSDTSLYLKQEPAFMKLDLPKGKAKSIFLAMREGEHLRLSLDGETIWRDYPSQFKNLKRTKNIMFHDYNLNKIKGAAQEVKRILSHARQDGIGTRVCVKFPIIVDNGKDLLEWLDVRPNADLYFLQYDGLMPNDLFLDIIEKCRSETLYSQFTYNITANSSSENDFVKNRLREIFRQVIISRSYRVFFSLKYDDNFFFDKTWEKVIDLFNFYQHSMRGLPESTYLKKIANDTLSDFAVKSIEYPPAYFGNKEFMRKSEMKQVINFVKKVYPELYNDFTTCSYNSLGGTL